MISDNVHGPARCSLCQQIATECICLKAKDIPKQKPDKHAGKRFDQGKSRMSLVPFVAIRALGDVYAYGERKYASWNWVKGMKWSRVSDSMLRHYERFQMGEERDAESNLLHSAHMAWNAITLLTYELLGVGEDDRWKERADFVPEDLEASLQKSFTDLDPEGTGKTE